MQQARERPQPTATTSANCVWAEQLRPMSLAPVIDADPDAPEPWLVRAYIEGPSRAHAVSTQGPMAADAVLALAAGLAEGLDAIHSVGVVHRDLHPRTCCLPTMIRGSSSSGSLAL